MKDSKLTILPLFKYSPLSLRLPYPKLCDTKVATPLFKPMTIAYAVIFMYILPNPTPAKRDADPNYPTKARFIISINIIELIEIAAGTPTLIISIKIYQLVFLVLFSLPSSFKLT